MEEAGGTGQALYQFSADEPGPWSSATLVGCATLHHSFNLSEPLFL